jgi:hypothetical protein
MIKPFNWSLLGVPMGEFQGLPEKSIKQLRYVGELHGVQVFENPHLPKGTMELRDGNRLVAVITGIGI